MNNSFIELLLIRRLLYNDLIWNCGAWSSKNSKLWGSLMAIIWHIRYQVCMSPIWRDGDCEGIETLFNVLCKVSAIPWVDLRGLWREGEGYEFLFFSKCMNSYWRRGVKWFYFKQSVFRLRRWDNQGNYTFEAQFFSKLLELIDFAWSQTMLLCLSNLKPDQ